MHENQYQRNYISKIRTQFLLALFGLDSHAWWMHMMYYHYSSGFAGNGTTVLWPARLRHRHYNHEYMENKPPAKQNKIVSRSCRGHTLWEVLRCFNKLEWLTKIHMHRALKCPHISENLWISLSSPYHMMKISKRWPNNNFIITCNF